MKNSTLFNSVSATDAPLAFAGDGSFKGLQELFTPYLSENGITTDSAFEAADTLGFRPGHPYKMLIYSLAATYSPTGKTAQSGLGSLRIELPFNYQGNLVESVWSRWMANDLYTWLDNSTYRDALNGQNIYLESSDHDVNLFNRQTQLFEQKLTSLGISYTSATFTKYDGYNAQSRSFLYDRLAYILKFHDKYLKDRNGKF